MQTLVQYLFQALAAAIAIIIHEFTKAAVSTALGDRLPADKGRLTLNPLKHLEFFGLITMWYTGLGWGTPVETSAVQYKNRKAGILITYITPSAVNIMVGILLALLHMILARTNLPYNVWVYLSGFLGVTAFYNVTLAVFNIIPVYPLDGARVLSVFLGPNASVATARYEKIFQIVLLVLIFMGYVNRLVNPIAGFILGFIR